MPGRPLAKTSKLNGGFRSLGAASRSTGHQGLSVQDTAVHRQNRGLGITLPVTFQNIQLGDADFSSRRISDI